MGRKTSLRARRVRRIRIPERKKVRRIKRKRIGKKKIWRIRRMAGALHADLVGRRIYHII